MSAPIFTSINQEQRKILEQLIEEWKSSPNKHISFFYYGSQEEYNEEMNNLHSPIVVPKPEEVEKARLCYTNTIKPKQEENVIRI